MSVSERANEREKRMRHEKDPPTRPRRDYWIAKCPKYLLISLLRSFHWGHGMIANNELIDKLQ